MGLESFLIGILGHMQSAEEQFAVGLEALEGKKSGWQHAAKAVRYIKYAADRGHTPACIRLGECHEYGIGTEQNPAEAARLYRLAADKGYAEALRRLGDCHRTGTGVEQNSAKALKLYHEASDQNDPGGQNGIGLCHEQGLGVQQDHAEAYKWYRMAADQGYAEAQYNLGRCYSKGIGVPLDHFKAAEYYTLAAEQASEGIDIRRRKQSRPLIVEAQFVLAECYENGIGVDQSDGKAQRWYRAAAHRSHPEASRRYTKYLDAESANSNN